MPRDAAELVGPPPVQESQPDVQAPVPEPVREGSLRRADLAVAVALSLVAAWVRAGALGPSSLWLDDAWVALATRAEGLGEAMTAGMTSPGFAVLLHWTEGLWGFSELRAQLLPFLFGVATPALLFLAARQARVPRAAALVGAAVVVAAPLHITYSTRVKPFTADAFMATIVLWTGWRVLAGPQATRRWIAFLVAAATAIMISAGAATSVLAASVAVAWAAHRHRCRRLAVPVLGALALFGAVWWVAALTPAVTAQLQNHWSDFYSARHLPDVLGDLVPIPPLAAVAGFTVSAGLVARRAPVLALMLVIPTASTAALATLGIAPLGGGRTDLHLYPSLALLVAVAAGTVTTTPRLRTLGYLGVAAALVLSAPTPAPYPQDDVRPLVHHVEATDDPIMVYPTTRWAYALYTRYPVEIRRDRSLIGALAVDIQSDRVAVLSSQRRRPERHRPAVTAVAGPLDRLWLVVTQARPDLAAIEDTLGQLGFRATTVLTRPGASATLWERDRALGA